MRKKSLIFLLLLSFLVLSSKKSDNLKHLFIHGEYEKLKAELLNRKDKKGSLLLAKTYLVTGDYSKAERVLKGLLKEKLSNDERIEVLTVYGELLLTIGKYKKAIEELEKIYNYPFAFRARFLLAKAYETIGERSKAESIYYRFVTEYNNGTIDENNGEGLSYVGFSCSKLNAWQDANRAFKEATIADPDRVETQILWAELFLEKYSPGYAEECIKDGLKVNPNHPELHFLMARIKIAQGFDFISAYREIDKALSINPNLFKAYSFRATLYIRERRWKEALAEVDKALRINPNDLYSLSVKKAIYYIIGDRVGVKRLSAKISSINPNYVEDTIVLAELLEWEHRYPEIISLIREKLKAFPDSWKLKTILGFNLLKIGEEKEGLSLLKECWDYDPYNVRNYNMLNLYEKIIPKEYVTIDRGQFKIRLPREQKDIILPYLLPLLKKGYRYYSKLYGIKPKKIRVELFNDIEQFSVRTAGLPHIGVQGVTFGPLFTALGPSSISINWGEIVLHELSHVFTILLSDYRVPKWFTEGIAVYDTYTQNPYWNYRAGAKFYRYVLEGHLPPLSEFNMIFTRALSSEEVALAYYGSAKFIQFEVERFGHSIVKEQLELFAKGLYEKEVFERTTKRTIEQLDREFREYILDKLSIYKDNYVLYPEWYIKEEGKEKYKRALSLYAKGKVEEAERLCSELLEKDKKNWYCLHLLSEIWFKRKDRDRFLKYTKLAIENRFDGYLLRMRLAILTQDLKKKIENLKRAIALDREESSPHLLLSEIYFKQGDRDKGVKELERGVSLNEHAIEPMRRLLDYYKERKDWKKLIEFGEKAIYLDTLNPKLHYYLGLAYIKTGKRRKGVKELKVALLCAKEDKDLKKRIEKLLRSVSSSN